MHVRVYGKYLLGTMLAAVGPIILAVWDKALEAYLVQRSPA
jgi:hypothetical protein